MKLQRLSCPLELKLVDTSTDQMSFTGYGAVFGNVDSYGDVIAPGAFKASLKESKKTGLWPAMLQQHGGMGLTADDLMPIGVWTDMEEDEKGLLMTGVLAPTQRGKDMHTLMSMKPRAAIDGLSIGYIPIKWKMASNPGEPRRTLEQVKVEEVSPVTFPANKLARVSSVKSLEDLATISEMEDFLRDAGSFSRSEAKTILSKFKSLSLRDADNDEPDTDLIQLLHAIRA